LEIMKIHLSMRKQNPDLITGLEEAVTRSEGYVAAEIESAIKDAVIEAFVSKQPVTGALIAEQFANMVPLSVAFADDFNEMKKWAEDNARPASLAVGEIKETGPVRQRVRQVATAGPIMDMDPTSIN